IINGRFFHFSCTNSFIVFVSVCIVIFYFFVINNNFSWSRNFGIVSPKEPNGHSLHIFVLYSSVFITQRTL
ncbi:MAG: hypothetical protein WKF85_08050, partial [Chitinophagaceae bacterium]